MTSRFIGLHLFSFLKNLGVPLTRIMLLYTLVVSIILSVSIDHGSCEDMGRADSLRRNIGDLMKGQCQFTDENLAFDQDELRDTTPPNHSEYDFIVVGAGSAGAVMAGRLSEIQNFSVLLIEAGGKEYSIMDIPALAAPLQLHDSIKWDYLAEPSNKYCLGFENHQSNWNRGKVMGGNSVFNYMLACRNNKEDYNGWAEMTGDDSWSYDNMLQYLKKLEAYDVKTVDYDKNLHNSDGPIPITGLPYFTKLGEAFVKGGQEMGYSGNTDFNGDRQIGFSYLQVNIKDGERWSSNRAYLRPASRRKNLKLTQHSLAEKVLIDKNNRAYGVRFSKAGKTYEVKARKEVILSAGALNSAQLLMLSGIGPANHLHDLGIKCIKDSRVGQNLMDHYAYGGLVFNVNDSSAFNSMPSLDSKENPAVDQYLKSRAGPLALPAFEGVGYARMDDLGRDNDRPDIEFMFASMAGMKDPTLAKVVKIDPKNIEVMAGDKANHSYWTCWPMLMLPKSRGRMLLRSNKITDKPKMIPNYFGHPDDIRVMRQGIREIIKLSKTKAFQKYGSDLYQVPLPNCQHLQKDSDPYWECAMRTYPFTIYHHSGTCRMGKEEHRSSVVNPECKVIGIEGLRVVDAGIMPRLISAHPHISIVAIAEKISDDIKRQYGYDKDGGDDDYYAEDEDETGEKEYDSLENKYGEEENDNVSENGHGYEYKKLEMGESRY